MSFVLQGRISDELTEITCGTQDWMKSDEPLFWRPPSKTDKRVCKATQASLNHILRGTTDRMIQRRQQELAAEAEKEEAEGSSSPKIFIKRPSHKPHRDQPAFDPHQEQMERRMEKLLKD